MCLLGTYMHVILYRIRWVLFSKGDWIFFLALIYIGAIAKIIEVYNYQIWDQNIQQKKRHCGTTVVT